MLIGTCILYLYIIPDKKKLGGIVESGLHIRSSVCPSVRPSVCLGRYIPNYLTFCSETLPIYLLPLCHAFSQVWENYNSKYLRAMRSPKFQTILIQNDRLREPFLRQNGANSVRPARYLTNHLTFCSETLHIYLLPLCNVFSQVSEN